MAALERPPGLHPAGPDGGGGQRSIDRRGPLGAFGKLLGVGDDSVRTLAAIAAVLGDPKVQGLVSQIHAANLRAHGAMVLAPTPIR